MREQVKKQKGTDYYKIVYCATGKMFLGGASLCRAPWARLLQLAPSLQYRTDQATTCWQHFRCICGPQMRRWWLLPKVSGCQLLTARAFKRFSEAKVAESDLRRGRLGEQHIAELDIPARHWEPSEHSQTRQTQTATSLGH